MHLGITLNKTHLDTVILQDDGAFCLQPKTPIQNDVVPALLAAFQSLYDSVGPARPPRRITVVSDIAHERHVLPPHGLQSLGEIDLQTTLQAIFNAPVSIASPAQALGLFESHLGVAKNSTLSCFLYLDKHISGSVTFGTRLWRGANRIAGNWGHMPLAWPVAAETEERPCWCGRHDCLESYISADGLASDYAAVTQKSLPIEVIATAADMQDLVARSVLQILDDRLGRTTASIINMFDPEMIVLGGQLAALDRLYVNVPRKWPGYLLAARAQTRLIRASQTKSVLARGAALIARNAD